MAKIVGGTPTTDTGTADSVGCDMAEFDEPAAHGNGRLRWAVLIQQQIGSIKSRANAAEQRVTVLEEALRSARHLVWIRLPDAGDDPLDEVYDVLDAALTPPTPAGEGECRHQWASMRNRAIKSGDWCPKCGAVREEGDETNPHVDTPTPAEQESKAPTAERWHGTDDDFKQGDWPRYWKTATGNRVIRFDSETVGFLLEADGNHKCIEITYSESQECGWSHLTRAQAEALVPPREGEGKIRKDHDMSLNADAGEAEREALAGKIWTDLDAAIQRIVNRDWIVEQIASILHQHAKGGE